MQILKTHWVYCLYFSGELIYVGRTVNLAQRVGVFQRRTGLVTSGEYFEYSTFEEAKNEELRLIKLHRPKFNKYLASSPTRLGQRNSDTHKERQARALRGRKLTDDHKSKLWKTRSRLPEANSFYGKKHTKEAVAKVRAATTAQFADPVKRERHRLACIEAAKRRKANGWWSSRK